jgi:CubicO group peptidase (beta-lactamase class C family)
VKATSLDHNVRHTMAPALNLRPSAMRAAGATARVTGVVLVLLFGTATAWSADAPIGRSTTAQLQRIVDKAGVESGAVGGQVSVILGTQRADFVFGSANAELNLPMTSDTVIQIGSTTKVFNAALVMTLVEQHRLDLDVPIVQYMPRFHVADAQARGAITLRQLLSMSSGLDNGPYTQFWNGDEALASYVDSLRTLPQLFAPGQGFGYSNAGMSIAGRIVEVVTGETWDTALRARILEPSGLSHTVTLADDLPFQRVSVGHLPGKEGHRPTVVRPWYITRAQGPAGSTLAASAHDVAEFGALFVNDGVASNGHRVLSHESISAMMTPTAPSPGGDFVAWGVGPSLMRWGTTDVWWHPGGNQSGVSMLYWIPDRRAVLAVVMNTPAAGGKFFKAISGPFAQAVFGIRATEAAPPAVPIAVPNPQRFVGTYLHTGARYEVSQSGSRLHFQMTMHYEGALEDEPPAAADEGDLIALGGDRFLLPLPDGGFESVSFFGSAKDGRAENLIAPYFAARRVGS